MKSLHYLFRWQRSNPLIWLTFIVIALYFAFSGDYTEEDIRLVNYHLEEAPELRTKPKRRGKYIVLTFKETTEEGHLDGVSYDGLSNREALLGLKTGDRLTVGIRKAKEINHTFRFKITSYFKPYTLSDSSNNYLTLDSYNDARHVENRWGLLFIALTAFLTYLNMKPE